MRFNPPPNWPRPPAGWTPPPGWAPDPSWGDAPADWQYWLEDEDEPEVAAHRAQHRADTAALTIGTPAGTPNGTPNGTPDSWSAGPSVELPAERRIELPVEHLATTPAAPAASFTGLIEGIVPPSSAPVPPSSAPVPPPSAPVPADGGWPLAPSGPAGYEEGPTLLSGYVPDEPDDVRPTGPGPHTIARGLGIPGLVPGGPTSVRRRRRRSAVLVPLVLLLVVALGAGGWFGNRAWQKYQERVRVDRAHQDVKDAYAAGHNAFLAGNCKAAATLLAKVGDPALEPELTERAVAEKAACAKLEAVRATGGGPSARVVAYLDYLDTRPGAPLQQVAAKEAATLLTGTPAGQLVGDALCERVEGLGDTVLTEAADRTSVLPPLLLRCGDAAVKADDPDAAEPLYRMIREDYAKAPEASRATSALAKLIVKDGRDGDHATLNPPAAASQDSSLGDKARIVVYNGTPHQMQLTLSGRSGVIGTAKPCADCEVFTSTASASCELKGEKLTLTVPAGRYTADLRFPDAPTRPGVGTWTLEAGTVYEGCYFVTRRGP